MESKQWNVISIDDVSLRNAFFDFPEQYNAYVEDVYVGHIKIHLGKLVVTDDKDDVIYVARTKGIENLDKNEREFFLINSKTALMLSMIYQLMSDGSDPVSKKYMYSAIQDIVCDGNFTLEECLQCCEVMYENYDI